jgi:hypothetical protein
MVGCFFGELFQSQKYRIMYILEHGWPMDGQVELLEGAGEDQLERKVTWEGFASTYTLVYESTLFEYV